MDHSDQHDAQHQHRGNPAQSKRKAVEDGFAKHSDRPSYRVHELSFTNGFVRAVAVIWGKRVSMYRGHPGGGNGVRVSPRWRFVVVPRLRFGLVLQRATG